MRSFRAAPAHPDEPEPARAVPLSKVITRIARLLLAIDDRTSRLRIAAAFLITLAAKVCAVASPLALADGINALAGGSLQRGGFSLFLGALGVWAALRFASTAGPQWRDALFAPISEEAQRRTGVHAFAHVQSLSVRFHETRRLGALSRIIERGVRSIDFLLRFLAFNIAPTLIELALAGAALSFKYGAGFAAIALATLTIYAWLTFGISEWRIAHRREMNDKDSEAMGRAVDSLLNYETVKSFGAEAREAARYDQSVSAYARASVKSSQSLAVLNVAQSAVMAAGLAAIVGYAGWRASLGAMGVGDITAIMLIMLNLYTPLNILGFAYREIKQSAIDMEKMFALFEQAPDVADAPDAKPLTARQGAVTFEQVGFSHEGRTAGVQNISFQIPPGKTLAIVGPSGAGKSTLLKLLFRFYDPDAGRILIDGQDIKSVTQSSLRQILGLVPQDVVLFNDTLRHNIAYGRPEASQAELRQAAQTAQLLDFIEALPEGWNTRVGERGLKLSGGERQRVGIARVVLKNPRILILDEATSSLDSRTESQVQQALDAAARGRTTLVVAHRLSTIAAADEIVVLKDGTIAERGRHAELLALNGAYADLWRKQAHEPVTADEYSIATTT